MTKHCIFRAPTPFPSLADIFNTDNQSINGASNYISTCSCIFHIFWYFYTILYFQRWQPEYKRGIKLFPHVLVFSKYSDNFSQSNIFHTDNQSISKTFPHISYVSFYFMHSLFVQMSKRPKMVFVVQTWFINMD